jgi:uncharacterized membrane protein YidH (DUF202 family)
MDVGVMFLVVGAGILVHHRMTRQKRERKNVWRRRDAGRPVGTDLWIVGAVVLMAVGLVFVLE